MEVQGTASGTSIPASSLDHLHPLYMYPSDSPGSLNVGILLTGSDNYTLWSTAMELALLGKNKVGFINGKVKKTQFTGDLIRLWDRCNAIVVSWILCNVSKDLHSGVLYCSDSYLIWEDLKERFNKVNSSRSFQLHKEIFSLVQGVSSVSLYYSRLKDLWDEYDSIMPPPTCTCSRSKEFFEQSQHQRMLQFLMGLNDNYSQARSQIMLMSQLPSINQDYAMVNQDESQRMVAGSSRVMSDMVPTAMFTSNSGPGSHKPRRSYNPNAFCDYCNIKGHMRSDCNKLLKCDFCHKTGHLKSNCYKMIGYPADYKGKRDTIVAGNSIYNAGHVSQQYQCDKTESIQSSYNPHMPQMMQSSYSNQMQV
ncbi:uncharacterized protein [Solanum lycopersicum]|uniref:uncharacterized protein n=1 Tax=Solanum lycopersicum TaxID=4081 RepID=UPI000532E924|nr:uncharacterized protein LOC104649602 [Solanum lycopersicum]